MSLSQLIQSEANALSSAMKEYKWEVNEAASDYHTVNIALKKASTSALLELCIKIDGQVQKNLQDQLLKIFEKIKFSERIIQFFASDGVDPRLESLLTKLDKLDIADSKKTEKYAASLIRLISNTTREKTRRQAQAAQLELNIKRLELLQTIPEVKICEISSADLNRYYEGHDERNKQAWIRIAQEKNSLSYVECALDENNQNKIDLFSPTFLRSLVCSGHDLMSRKFDFQQQNLTQPTEPILQRIMDNPIALCADHSLDQTKECFASLQKLKEESNKADFCAFICSEELHLAVSMHSDNLFSLFNQYGDAKCKKYPYVALFGNLDQAANFVHDLLFGRPVVFIPLSNHKKENKPKIIDQFAAPIVALQKMIDALLPQSEDGYIKALEELEKLYGKCFLPSADNQEIADRIDFHFHHIQKTEYLEIAPIEKDSDSDEELRAVQRTQAELLLFLLEYTYRHEFIDIMVPEIFEILEKLELDAKDLPQGYKNLAHNLFEKLDAIYSEAYKKNPVMVSPYHVSFNSAFGRNAFIGAAKNLVQDKYKIQAVEELGQSLKATWKIGC